MLSVRYLMSAVITAGLAVLMEEEEEERKRRMRMRRRRRYWIHPIIANRPTRGQFWAMYENLRGFEDKFFNYTRMSIASFDELLGLVDIHLRRQNTSYRRSISSTERLIITLRYLATGHSLVSLHFEFMAGKSTISYIIRETCQILWDVLNTIVMKRPTQENWCDIAELYWNRCNFPNCIGAIDGKHVHVIKPIGSGSMFFNYKKYCSFVLLAVADSSYCFTYIDIGSYGSTCDARIFANSSFGERLRDNQLDLPESRPLPGTTGPPLPYVFVADEAFALGKHIMRPYSNRILTTPKKVFNYRLTRARRVVECSFGILANKWRFLHTPIALHIENAVIAVKAACVLHNYVRVRDRYCFEDSLMHDMESAHLSAARGSSDGATVRGQFTSYFVSPAGEIQWQMDAIS